MKLEKLQKNIIKEINREYHKHNNNQNDFVMGDMIKGLTITLFIIALSVLFILFMGNKL